MVVSRKDWELTISRIWLAEMNTDLHLDFYHLDWHLVKKKKQTEIDKYWLFSSKNTKWEHPKPDGKKKQ